MQLHVGNLSYQTDEDGLRAVFEPYGPVTSVRILRDRDSGQSRGFGFVEIDDDDGARAAIEAVNGLNVSGRRLKVTEALPPGEARPRRNFARY